METLTPALTVTITIAFLTVFLIFVTALKYTMTSVFARTRLAMTAFFCFIVLTLTLSFFHFAFDTLPYAVPALAAGVIVGYIFGVRTEMQKVRVHGLQHYMQHFAHLHVHDARAFTWWSFINFYSVMGGLLLINLVGLSSIILHGSESAAIVTCVVGAFLIGTIIPYLVHLWTVGMRYR